jgi:hypothetical protein
MDPTPQEIVTLTSIDAVSDWSELQGSVTDGPRGALYSALGCLGSEKPRTIAMLSPEEYNEIIANIKMKNSEGADIELTPTQLSQMGLVGRACRVVCGVVQTVQYNDPNQAYLSNLELTQAQTQLAIAQSKDLQKKMANTVKCNIVTSQVDETEAIMLSETEIQKAYKRYIDLKEDYPESEVNVSNEQLSGYKSILDRSTFYVDFAIWVPNHMRNFKKLKLAGVRIASDGKLVPTELSGPPSFELWEKSYDLLTTAMIMMGVMSLSKIEAYKKKIKGYVTKFGEGVWLVIYQADVRFRMEHLLTLRRRGADEADAAARAGGIHEYDPNRPWDWCMKKGLDDFHFWKDTLEDPALLIRTRTSTLSALAGNDTPIDGKHIEEANSQVSNFGPPVKKQKLQHEVRTPKNAHNVENGQYVTNRKGKKLCQAFQSGSCTHTKPGGIACSAGLGLHQCAKCLSPAHGANACSEAPKDYPNKGKGKGKGKGKNKGRW